MPATLSILILRKVRVVEGPSTFSCFRGTPSRVHVLVRSCRFTFVGASCADGKEIIKVVKAGYHMLTTPMHLLQLRISGKRKLGVDKYSPIP